MKVTTEKKVTVTLELTGQEAYDLALILGSLPAGTVKRCVKSAWGVIKRACKNEVTYELLYYRLQEAGVLDLFPPGKP